MARAMARLPIFLLVSLLLGSARAQDATEFGRFKAELHIQPTTFLPPRGADLKHYRLVWRSFNEATLERDRDPQRVRERITLKEMLVELEKHRHGKEYPIIYSFLSFHGDKYAYIRADYQTGVPRGEDLYFERVR